MEANAYKVILAYFRGVDAAGKRRVLYHGTSPNFARKILSEGLVPDPKKRSWVEDSEATFEMLPRTSLPGVYLTDNLLTALSSARHARSSSESDFAIVVVDVEEKTLVHDEDTLKGALKFNVRHMMPEGRTFMGPVVLSMYDRMVKGELDDGIEKSAKAFLSNTDMSSVRGYGENRMPLAIDLYKAYLTRQTAYTVPEVSWFAKEKDWKKMKEEISRRFEVDLSGLPKPEEADRVLMEKLRRVSDKLRPSQAAGYAASNLNKTYRSLESIAFSGSNRIIAIVLIHIATTPYRIKFIYGNPEDPKLDKFFKDFREKMSDRYTVEDKSGKSVIKSQTAKSTTEMVHV